MVRPIARGLSTPDIAADLLLSAVSSRGELMAKLFAERYSGAVHATAVHIH